MIPTTVTNSPPSASGVQNGTNTTGATGVGVVVGGGGAAVAQANYNSIVLGLASLILEGRPIADDEYQQPTPPPLPPTPTQTPPLASTRTQFTREWLELQELQRFGAGNGGGGRLSPRPSTSRASQLGASGASGMGANSYFHPHTQPHRVVNITTNPYALSNATPSTPLYATSYGYAAMGGSGVGASSAASGSAESSSSTHQRWTQKLCQLRQVSPAAQSVSAAAEPELVALAINDMSSDHAGGDFEIVRRVLLNRGGLAAASTTATATTGSAASSPGSGSGSDNILHSLQSLATTCLRGGPPGPPETTTLQNIWPGSGGGSSFYAPSTGGGGGGGREVGGLGASSAALSDDSEAGHVGGWRYRNRSFLDFSWASERAGRNKQNTIPTPTPPVNSASRVGVGVAAAATLTATATTTNNSNTNTNNNNTTRPKHGPHCDQFLRKMGLSKAENADATEEHFCDMSYVNITCSRWRAHCLKMEAIVARREAVCIEVYLGPVNHKILLEQWIISPKEKSPPPNMTLPSLCSAIRSQLYFSQIVAWCDLLRKCDKSIYETGRVIFASGSAMDTTAGDLATPTHSANVTPSSSPHGSAAYACTRRPRLNIFYRIKRYDAAVEPAFTTKASVHNFPQVNIAENFSVSVCVKSLPRMNGGIPKVVSRQPITPSPPIILEHPAEASGGDGAVCRGARVRGCTRFNEAEAVSTPTCGGGLCATTPTGMGARIAVDSSRSNPSATTTTKPQTSCDKQPQQQQNQYQPQQQGPQHNPQSTMERDELDGTLSHRERQLQKYRKRMLKRDKKRERKPSSDELELDLELGEPTTTEPMDTEVEPHRSHQRNIEMISTGTQTSLTSCQQCGNEKTLLCLNCSIADDDTTASEMDDLDESSCSLSSNDLIVGTPRNKAELLLQAIQRTPKNKKKQGQQQHQQQQQQGQRMDNDLSNDAARRQTNNNHVLPAAKAPPSGCQVCKRQKTQHNFGNDKAEGGNSGVGGATTITSVILTGSAMAGAVSTTENAPDAEEDGDGKQYSANGHQSNGLKMEQEVLPLQEEEKEVCRSSTKLTPKIERCSLGAASSPSAEEHNYASAANNLNLECDEEGAIVVKFKTPTSNLSSKLQDPQTGSGLSRVGQRKQSPKPSLLRINCSNAGGVFAGPLDQEMPQSNGSLLLRKVLPKVNLTSIFCGSSSAPNAIGGSSAESGGSSHSGEMAFSFEPSALNHTKSSSTVAAVVEDANIPVQKSYSAPTLPNSLSLSPRFAKQAAFYKRRSRHLSDRSDRSSLGSDEQLSDEDFESGMCSPATSPLKCRSRVAAQFGKRPLIGNLEETLLQKRLLPKVEVMGFRVLLGASGSFCPTQLTIPATAYFYEFYGESLSTPYLSDVRLPRKGYYVPRFGTLQVTLLNPAGTVVRMFVVPYDMRDMPPLHRTFIRQRILSESPTKMDGTSNLNCNGNRSGVGSGEHGGSSSGKLGLIITAEQMKRLRYSIHLKFQTSRTGRLLVHSDIRFVISRRTDCDTAAAHAKGVLEAPNELITDTLIPTEPRYYARPENPSKI